MSRLGPAAHARLKQPEPGDVLEQPRRPVDAAFVGEIELARSRRDDGCADFRAQERPRARAEKRAAGVGGHRRECRSGVMTRGRHHRRVGQRSRHIVSNSADDCARLDQRLEQVRRQAEFRDQRRRPRAALRVDHLCRGRDGVLGRQTAGEPVVQQIGNRDERGRGPQKVRRRSLRRIELKQGIEVQKLNAGGRVDAFGRDLPEHLRRRIVAARIAIVIRVLEQLALLAQKREVASPGIEADARECDVGDVLETRFDFVPETQDVPVKRAIRAHGDVGKTPDVLERQHAAVEPSEDRSSALGTEIKSQKPCAHALNSIYVGHA